VDRTLPPGAVPFAKLVRFDRPIGTFLLAWPCFWSIAIAAPPGALPDATLLALFGVGSLLLRGAGYTLKPEDPKPKTINWKRLLPTKTLHPRP
jgi:4-hydroxybenzoate polyprenyltransferase